MGTEYRVKVKATCIRELTSKGFAVNINECAEGEYWLLDKSLSNLQHGVDQYGLEVVSPCEVIPV